MVLEHCEGVGRLFPEMLRFGCSVQVGEVQCARKMRDCGIFPGGQLFCCAVFYASEGKKSKNWLCSVNVVHAEISNIRLSVITLFGITTVFPSRGERVF